MNKLRTGGFGYLIIFMWLTLGFGCRQDDALSLVVIPDTQSVFETNPEIFKKQMEWVAQNRDSFDFVIHVGDITQDNSREEWILAKEFFQKLEGNVPFTFSLGNHDMGSLPGKFADTRNTELANEFFRVEELERHCKLSGSFPEGMVDNLYHTFKQGKRNWLVISLEFGPRDKVLDWANQVVANHPGHQVIINTHAYLYEDDSRMGEGDFWRPQAYGVGKDTGTEQVNDGEQVWDKFIKQHENIIMVFSGHVLKSGVSTVVSEGINGNKVYQMLANYQRGVEDRGKGDNGYLRLIKIYPKANRFEVKTYSPWFDRFLTDPEHDFVFENVTFIN